MSKEEVKAKDKTNFKKYWNDFGKQINYLIFIMMFLHFFFMCFLSWKEDKNTIFTEFTHDFKYIYMMVLGLNIWKAKSEWILDKAHKWKMSVKDLIAFTKVIGKTDKYPTESEGIDFGSGSYEDEITPTTDEVI